MISCENIVVTILVRQDPGIWQFWRYFLILSTNSYIKRSPNIAKIAKSLGLAEEDKIEDARKCAEMGSGGKKVVMLNFFQLELSPCQFFVKIVLSSMKFQKFLDL